MVALIHMQSACMSCVVTNPGMQYVGGLTENDLILAAKVNAIIITDLLPKKKARFWA